MERWFYNGTYMPDGKPITVAASSEVQEEEFLRRGFRPVEDDTAGKAGGRRRKDKPLKTDRR